MSVQAKKINFLMAMLFAVIFLLLLAPASAFAVEGPAVMITNYVVEPEVLMPGDTGTITVTIRNMGTLSTETETKTVTTMYTSATKTTATISAEIENIRLSSRSRDIEWFREGSQRSEYYNVGALGPGESIAISLPIKATTFAQDGTYLPEVCIEVENGENVRFPVPVKVDSSVVEILEKDIPSEISLSESKEIEIVVANNRPNLVSGVNVRMKLKSDGLEFTPEQIFIGDLGAYEKKEINFTFTPIAAGNKEFSFEVSYKNGINSHQNEFKSSILVRSIADVKLILVNAPGSVLKGEIAKIDFDVANGKAKDIKAVSVMPEIEGLRILPSEYFIGDMEVGDVFSASFDVYTSSLHIGDTEIPFKLVFRDVDTDRRYETTGYLVHIEVKEPHKSELPNLALFVALVIIFIPVAVFVWVRVKRK
ncbi:hypothetical protein CW713_08050 [Methanophagales archaeon]|nr:MAG: hypothetical protein CW713_08050 [Methanophagales archaeon]